MHLCVSLCVQVLGEVVLSSGYLAYLGPVSGSLRAQVEAEWADILRRNNVQGETTEPRTRRHHVLLGRLDIRHVGMTCCVGCMGRMLFPCVHSLGVPY